MSLAPAFFCSEFFDELAVGSAPAGLLPLRSTWTTSRSPWHRVAVSCIQPCCAVARCLLRKSWLDSVGCGMAKIMHSRHGSSCFSASRLSEILKRSNNIWSTHSVELQCASMQLASCPAWRRLPAKTSSARKNPNVSLLQGGMTCLFPGPRLGPESACVGRPLLLLWLCCPRGCWPCSSFGFSSSSLGPRVLPRCRLETRCREASPQASGGLWISLAHQEQCCNSLI